MNTQLSNFLQTHLNNTNKTIELQFEGKVVHKGERSRGFIVEVAPNQKLPNSYAQRYNLTSINFK